MKQAIETGEFILTLPEDFHSNYFDPLELFPDTEKADVTCIDMYLIALKKFKVLNNNDMFSTHLFIKNALYLLGYFNVEIETTKLSFDNLNLKQLIFVVVAATRWVGRVKTVDRIFVYVENVPVDFNEVIKNLKEIET